MSNRIQLQSSFITGAEFIFEQRKLRMYFKNGKIYEYENIDPETYEALKTCESPGQFLNEHLKDKYEHKEINPEWLTCGSAIEDIQAGDRLERCAELGLIRKMQIPKI